MDQEKRRAAILDLQKRCYDCHECPLGRRVVAGHDPHVFASGNLDAIVMFIGEAPGADEVLRRIPLVGRCGRFFDEHMLAPAGLSRQSVYVTNAVLCRPNEQNRTPHLGEMEICRVHLDAQIRLVRPRLLVTMGNAALWTVCGVQKITKSRGDLRWSRRWSNGKKIPVLPMFHPSYCLRGSGLAEMEKDVRLLGRLEEAFRRGSIAAVEDIHWLCDIDAAIGEANG